MNNTQSAKTCTCLILSALMIFGTFALKNKVHDLEKELIRINQNIKTDIRAIHVLKAEWSHLNNPQRLRELAQKHIELKPIKAEQIIDYASLPFEYETNDNRRILARQNISNTARRNKNLKKLAKVQN